MHIYHVLTTQLMFKICDTSLTCHIVLIIAKIKILNISVPYAHLLSKKRIIYYPGVQLRYIIVLRYYSNTVFITL